MHRLLSALVAGAAALALGLAFLLHATPADTAVTRYKIDKSHSALLWKVKHLGVSWTHGRFNDFNGTFAVDDADLGNAKVEIDISAESIDSNEEKRDTHLRSKDFFDVENHPSISFTSTDVTKAGEGVYRVAGNFTLLGVEKPVVLRMTKVGEGKDPWGNYRMGFEGRVVIKRSEFGMKHMLGGIGDEVHITLGVEGIRMGDKPAK